MTPPELLERRVADAFRHVAAATPIPPAPSAHAPHAQPHRVSRRWKRLAFGGGVALTVMAAGYGGAVASGVADAPSAFFGADNAKTDTAVVLATYPGPDDLSVKVELADATGGQRCLSFQVLPRQPNSPPNNGTGCAQWKTNEFGKDGTGNCCDVSPSGLSFQLFVRTAGSATTAKLEQGGQVRELLVRSGYVLGWAAADQPFTVTGYDSGGAAIGRFTVDPPTGPTPQDLTRLAHESPAAHTVCGTSAPCH